MYNFFQKLECGHVYPLIKYLLIVLLTYLYQIIANHQLKSNLILIINVNCFEMFSPKCNHILKVMNYVTEVSDFCNLRTLTMGQ